MAKNKEWMEAKGKTGEHKVTPLGMASRCLMYPLRLCFLMRVAMTSGRIEKMSHGCSRSCRCRVDTPFIRLITTYVYVHLVAVS